MLNFSDFFFLEKSTDDCIPKSLKITENSIDKNFNLKFDLKIHEILFLFPLNLKRLDHFQCKFIHLFVFNGLQFHR